MDSSVEAGVLESPKQRAFGSLKPKKKPNGFAPSLCRAASEVDDFISLLHGSDPVRVELSRLENEVRDKERELGDANAEIKGLKNSERLKEKAVEELMEELKKMHEKLKATEAAVESKNLEFKKINEEKRAAIAAQFAAEATLRRVHATQKDDDMPPIEALITPLEAELKLARSEVAKLQEDNRALDRLNKSKEAALMEADRTVQMALAKASLVDDLQNKNQELMKQIDICQEENKILDKMHRHKVGEVEKLMQTVHELEEAVLAGGAAANAVRDYQRKVQEINEEKRILDRELARAKISANRVAVVVANEWKDGNDKVMPVRQWLEERRIFQGELQHLKDKLTIAERTAKAETQLKEKYQLRFKVLEERLKSSENPTSCSPAKGGVNNDHLRCQPLGGAKHGFRSLSNGFSMKRAMSHKQSSQINGACEVLQRSKTLQNFTDSSGSLNGENSLSDDGTTHSNGSVAVSKIKLGSEDYVSGMVYDMLQKEVIALRKACCLKDQNLKDKDVAIEMLTKKVETLNKAIEVEGKKTRREIAAMEKEFASLQTGKDDQRKRRASVTRAL